MTRIVAGSAGGRTLRVPASGTRPTAERVREALYSRLDHLAAVAGARVLDLYAGTGALGLEAASRGARDVVLVEAARPAARLIAENARTLGLTARCRVVTARVQTYLAGLAAADSAGGDTGALFDLVLIDPPYDVTEDDLAAVLDALTAPGVLHPDAVVVVERAKRSGEPAWPAGLTREDARTYGDTALWFAMPPASVDATDDDAAPAADPPAPQVPQHVPPQGPAPVPEEMP